MCPIFVSKLIEHVGTLVLTSLIGQHAISAFLVLWSGRRALRLKPSIEPQVFPENSPNTSPNHHGVSGSKEVSRSVNPFYLFTDKTTPTKAKLVATANLLLWCTVLTPGGIFNSWLNSLAENDESSNAVVTESTIAWFGTTANLVGGLATFITPPLIATIGKYKAAVISQVFQSGCLLIAAFMFYSFQNAQHHNGGSIVFGFLMPVAVSRLGLWSFALSEQQVLQEAVPKSNQTIFFNSEMGLANTMYLLILFLSYIFESTLTQLRSASSLERRRRQ